MPSLLREEVNALADDRFVIIDEIQKAPALLDEVHYLIEEKGRRFGLCGSSARKVRRGHANLLGGRALRYELLGLTAPELGDDFSINKLLNAGPLPRHYLSSNPDALLRSYVDTYLKEEILEEGLTRNLPVFSDFLRVAALGDTEVTNLANIARECHMAASTVREHYSILEDTLLATFVKAFTPRPKRRTVQAPKFYFRDVGVVNQLARRGPVKRGSSAFGKAFENWVFHELSCHSRYSEKWYDISYWRLSSGIEVDFILGDGEVAIEAKGKERLRTDDHKHLLQFKKDYPHVKKLIMVSASDAIRKIDGGILVLPARDFTAALWGGEIL
jgi:predicted AAA+ superfamily ATPase